MIEFYLYTPAESSFGINEIGSISNSIIAILTLFLAYYVFVYQKKKDKESDDKAQQEHKKNIKLQWFKEIIIQPKIDKVFQFYENLREIKNKINANELSENEKIDLINYIKEKQSEFRKSFLDLLQFVSPELHDNLSKSIDILTDSLTLSISDDELKLNNPKTFEREINSKIQESYNNLFTQIFNYCG